jgi:hypothetical protein
MDSSKEELRIKPNVRTESGPLTKLDQPWSEWVQPVWDVVAKVPDYIGEFFADNQKPLLTIGLVIAGLVTVKVTLAVLDAIDDVPLLAPILQLVGLGYTGWFVYRYLWKATSRQELVKEFDVLKNQIFGDEGQNS